MNFICRSIAQRVLLAATASVLAACGGSDSDPVVSPAAAGTLRVALADAPACGYDEVNVTVEKVRVHQSGTAADDAGGWSEVVLNPVKRVNLLDLTNGVLEELGTTSLPAGTYTLLRLVLSSNSATTPMANSVLPTGGTETALVTPSGPQTGLKINTHINVASNQLTDVVLDFDACKSVVLAGQTGRHLLQPVLSILPRVATPGLAVEGYVTGVIATGSTSVSLQQAGVVARSTVPDANGKFLLSPVAAGNYDLVITASGRVTSIVTGVPVAAAGKTVVNASTSPIDPPISANRNASGNVTTTGTTTIPSATVRALQLTGASTIEVIARPVDADTGAYSFSLPTAAPGKTAFAAGATTLTFAPDTAAAAKYTLEARVPGKPTQTASIDLTSADVITPFAFAP
jgi:hypothetical protein